MVKSEGKVYQKAKPKSSALRAGADALASKPLKIVAPGPDPDDQPFVPEEELEGPMTQGDGLMMAKARRQRSYEQPSQLHTPTTDDGDEFVPEQEVEGLFTQGDGLMAAKARRSPQKPLVAV